MDESEHLHRHTLNEFLDGELTAPARQIVAAHLEKCPLCAAQLEEIQQVFLALSELPEASLERDLSPSILAALHAERGSVGFKPTLSARRSNLQTPLSLRLFFALQLGTALTMLLFIWPTFVARISTLFAPWISRWEAFKTGISLVGWSARLQTLWLSAQETAVEIFNFWDQFARWPAPLQIPMVAWIAGLIVIILLWLAANRLLLDHGRLRNSSLSTPRRSG